MKFIISNSPYSNNISSFKYEDNSEPTAQIKKPAAGIFKLKKPIAGF